MLLRAKADVEAKDKVLEATRGIRYIGNIRAQPDQRCHNITKLSPWSKMLVEPGQGWHRMMWACEGHNGGQDSS